MNVGGNESPSQIAHTGGNRLAQGINWTKGKEISKQTIVLPRELVIL